MAGILGLVGLLSLAGLALGAVLFQKDVTFNYANQTLPTTTETTVQTSNLVPVPFVTAKVLASFQVTVGVGTGTTSITLRIYRQAAGGALVLLANPSVNVTAGNTIVLVLQTAESISGLGVVGYTATVQQNAATGNGTVNAATLEVEVMSG